jgi:hypothetical protein
VRHQELSEAWDAEELAADLSSLWAKNRIILARPSWSASLEDVGRSLQALRYRAESPDVATVIDRLLTRGFGDCEDLCAAWHEWAKATRGPRSDVQSLLTPGGGVKQYHCFLRISGRVFDPSVQGGMPRPPDSIYQDPRAVVIAA